MKPTQTSDSARKMHEITSLVSDLAILADFAPSGLRLMSLFTTVAHGRAPILIERTSKFMFRRMLSLTLIALIVLVLASLPASLAQQQQPLPWEALTNSDIVQLVKANVS